MPLCPRLSTALFALYLLLFTVSAPAADYVQDHVIVKFKPTAIAAGGAGLSNVDRTTATSLLGLPAGAELEETEFARLQRKSRVSRGAQNTPDTIDLNRHMLLKLPAGMTVEECLTALQNNPSLEYAEPNYIGYGGETLPNDPDFPDEWHHRNTANTNADIRTPDAWDIAQGSTGVVLAVLDTGINKNLGVFLGRSLQGYDFVNNDDEPIDDNSHGTTVAATAAATGNDGNLLAGVDWNCRILPVKVLNSGNSGTYADITDGIDWAVTNGADVICMSIGGTSADTTLSNAIMNAIAEGVIFVTITHNDGTANVRFPGRMQTCITLSATTSNDERWVSSNYGPANDLAAPGVNIRIVTRFGTLGNWSGTSYSCPLASGVATLIKSLRPEIEQRDMEQILRKAVDDEVGNFQDSQGWDQYHGSGRLNAYKALSIITNMEGKVFIRQYTIDGDLTLQEQEHWRVSNGMNLYADFNGDDLYVATEDAGEGNDHFIFVTDNPNGGVSNAPWAKAGTLSGLKYFLADENDGTYDAWFSGGAEDSTLPSKTTGVNGGYLEGTMNLADTFGYIPSNIYIAVGPYATADAGALSAGSQVPSGNADGNIDSNEYYVLNIGSYDTDGDGLTDLEEDANADGVVDSGESSAFVVDTDGDGLDDGDEVNTYGSDPSKVDTDGDGLRDDEEVVAGSDPDDANDRFMGVGVPGGLTPTNEFHLQWDGLTGRIYSVYYSAGPLSPTGLGWVATSYADVPGIVGVMTYTNDITSVTARYFKVHVSLP